MAGVVLPVQLLFKAARGRDLFYPTMQQVVGVRHVCRRAAEVNGSKIARLVIAESYRVSHTCGVILPSYGYNALMQHFIVWEVMWMFTFYLFISYLRVRYKVNVSLYFK